MLKGKEAPRGAQELSLCPCIIGTNLAKIQSVFCGPDNSTEVAG